MSAYVVREKLGAWTSAILEEEEWMEQKQTQRRDTFGATYTRPAEKVRIARERERERDMCVHEGWPFSFPRWPNAPHLLRAVHAVRRPSCATFVAAPLASDVDHALLGMASAELSLRGAIDSVRRPRDAAAVPAPLAADVDHLIEGVLRAKLSSRGAVTSVGRSLDAPPVTTFLHHPVLPPSLSFLFSRRFRGCLVRRTPMPELVALPKAIPQRVRDCFGLTAGDDNILDTLWCKYCGARGRGGG